MSRYDCYDYDCYDAARDRAWDRTAEFLSDRGFNARDLQDAGYEIDVLSWDEGDPEVIEIRKDLDARVHVARRDHKDGKVKAGDTYKVITSRFIEYDTRKSHHRHRKIVVARAQRAA